jgi:hypothetical protein
MRGCLACARLVFVYVSCVLIFAWAVLVKCDDGVGL